MIDKNTIDMTVSELVYSGVQLYIDRCGWNWYDDTSTEAIASDIHQTFGVLIDYDVIDEVINTNLNIQTTVKLGK